MATQFGTFEQLLETAPIELKPIMQRLYDVLCEQHQDATIITRMGDRATTFGLGPQKMKQGYCYLMPQKSWINLGFYQGAHLPDPANLLEGTGKALRHIKVATLEMCENPELTNLIIAAQTERRQALGLPS